MIEGYPPVPIRAGSLPL